MSFCTNCGINIRENRFCTQCGTKNILFEEHSNVVSLNENKTGLLEKETEIQSRKTINKGKELKQKFKSHEAISKDLNEKESKNQSSRKSSFSNNKFLIGLYILSSVIMLGLLIKSLNTDDGNRFLGGEGKLVVQENITDIREDILTESRKHIGIPYSFGSKDPSTGFDSSGYVSYVYEKVLKIKLPAGSRNQFSSGGGVMVGFDQLKPGDLMFFSHDGRQIQHVGIYIDENHFIHAPRTGRRISIDELGRYWKQKFVKGKTFIK